jgi:hypothetical protein
MAEQVAIPNNNSNFKLIVLKAGHWPVFTTFVIRPSFPVEVGSSLLGFEVA